MKIIMLLGIGILAIASTGCTSLAKMTIVGKAIEDRPMPHKDENYTLVKENGSTIFGLSGKGKTALAEQERKIEQKKARRKARAQLVLPIAGISDWALSWPAAVIYGLGRAGPDMGSPSFGNFSAPDLSGMNFGGMAVYGDSADSVYGCEVAEVAPIRSLVDCKTRIEGQKAGGDHA